VAAGIRSSRISRAIGVAIWIASGPGVVACGPQDGTIETRSAIYQGSRDDADDAVVALRIGDASSYRLCTGALVAPNVVLTARHCTSVRATETIGCTASGQSTNGDQFLGDVPPTDIHVFVGAAPALSGAARANGARVFRPSSNALCNSDVALVVLDRSIPEVKPLAVRLGARTMPGEQMRSIGYGENDASYTSGIRFSKDDVMVLAVGAGVQKDGTVLGDAEFEIGRATCQGDSGGPALSLRTGAIIGVASRGVACTLDYGHVYAQPAAFRRLFDDAFAVAGGAPIEEPSPEPPRQTESVSVPPMSHGGCRASPEMPSDAALVTMGGLFIAASALRRRRR
jgi:hypothetical protein